MTPFTEPLRYAYPLTPDSLVVEIGGYKGAWAKTMAEKHGCRVLSFEPVPAFYDEAMLNFMLPPLSERVCVENCGIAGTTRRETFHVHGELTGPAAQGEPVEVQLMGVDAMMDHSWVDGRVIDVLSINAEGGEYEILEALLDAGLMSFFTHLQVQFHSVVIAARNRRESIRNRLRITHRPAWEIPDDLDCTWDGWEIKP